MSNKSNQMKIAIVSGTSKKGDSVRGIGAHNSSLFESFEENKNKKIEMPEVSKDDDLSKYDVVQMQDSTRGGRKNLRHMLVMA